MIPDRFLFYFMDTNTAMEGVTLWRYKMAVLIADVLSGIVGYCTTTRLSFDLQMRAAWGW
jgi:hypothetical protein